MMPEMLVTEMFWFHLRKTYKHNNQQGGDLCWGEGAPTYQVTCPFAQIVKQCWVKK